MEVYVDMLFLVNLALNYWALWLTALLQGIPRRGRALLLSALFGAVYALGMLTPLANMFGHSVSKLLLATLMMLLAFRPSKVQQLVQSVALFLVVSFITAGFVVGLNSLLNQGQVDGMTLAYGDLPAWVLGLAVCLLALFSRRFLNLMENRLVHVANHAQIETTLFGHQVKLEGLVDSGNQLAEPFSGRPVVVVTLQSIAQYLPEQLIILALATNPLEQDLEHLAENAWVDRVRFIPFHSVAKKSGVLVGLKTDSVLVSTRDGQVSSAGVVLAISAEGLSRGDNYQALIPTRLLPKAALQKT